MRRSEAARYARWAAGLAILLFLTVAGNFAYRSYQTARTRRQAPPVVPPAVQQQSNEFSFSKVEQDRTLFTVRASRATEFKAGGLARLEDVWITIYGRQNQRFDTIHTRNCDYAPTTGKITCAGEVQIDLESAEERKQRPGQRVIHVGTVNVNFNRETGELHTENPVVFRFPYGHGRGAGVTYSTRDAKITVHRDVEVTLTAGRQNKAVEPTVLTGSGLEYQRDSRVMRLLPPVRVKQGGRELSAGALALEFDADLRARRLLANGNPQYQSAEARGQLLVGATEIVMLLNRDGWIERISANGNVLGRLKHSSGDDHLRAERAEMVMEPARNLARTLLATGNVFLDAVHGRATRTLQTESLRLDFASGRRPAERHIDRAETFAAASLELKSGENSTRVRGERLAAQFDDRNFVRALRATQGVETERRMGTRPPQSTSSLELAMNFAPGGEWIEGEQTGNVRFKEAERSAQADRAKLVRATDTVTLTGHASVSDSLSRTSAQSLTFNQRTGEIRAEGAVRTSYFQAERNGLTNLAPQPAHFSAEHLQANRDSGRALYSGHARLWQGDAVIEAEAIELLRAERRLKAQGNVSALVPQVANPSPGSASSAAKAAAVGAERTLWRARAARMTYWSEEGKVLLEEDVNAQSQVGLILSRTLELHLTSANNGPKQLSKAIATGGATVRQGDRKGSADRAEYTAADGKFVLSGGKPTLYDAALGTTTGRQLTFFLSDDKILVDSEEGSRTLSRHRVEK
jgi:lipopolysaccharide export system protein LptA